MAAVVALVIVVGYDTGRVSVLAAAVFASFALAASLYAARPMIARVIPPLSGHGLGLFRVAWALMLLWVLEQLVDVLPSEALPREVHLVNSTAIRLSFFDWIGERPAVYHGIGTATTIAIVFFAAGMFTRTAYAVVGAGFTALAFTGVAVNQVGHEWSLPVLVIVALVVVPWGDALSLDETIRRLRGKQLRRRTRSYGVALWLPGLLLGTAWAAASYAKLSRAGLDWITSGAPKYHFILDNKNAHADWGLWIATHPSLSVALAVGAIVLELGFILNAAFPGPWVRLAFAAGAAAFFVSTYLLQDVEWRGWYIPLLALLPWEPLAAALRRVTPRRTVLIDGSCRLCRRTARVLHALDWLDRLTFVNANRDDLQRVAPSVTREAALRRMGVVRSGGTQAFYGYDAYVAIAWSIPFAWPLAPLLSLPPIRRLGRHVYERVAGARRRHDCGDACAGAATSPHLPRRSRVVSGRTLTLAGALALSAALVGQIYASDRRRERLPLLSDYPMYAYTYASTEEFNRKLERGKSDFHVFSTNARETDISARLDAAFALGPFLEALFVARDRVAPWPTLRQRVKDARSRYAIASGTLLERVEIVGDLVRFDWDRGMFVRRPGVRLGVLDLRTLALSPPA